MSNKYFLYVGNAYPHKNLDKLIEAIVLLNQEVRGPVLLKISSSRSVFTQKLENVIKRFRADALVELLGFVPDEKLPELYRNSVAFVFPSLSEGFGLPGLEAMNAGTLVLASNIPVFREVYQNHVAYFNPQSAGAIKDTMKKALRLTDEKRREIIIGAMSFSKRYSWAKMAEETLKIYYYETAKSSDSLRQSK